jgi:hypothetical protein
MHLSVFPNSILNGFAFYMHYKVGAGQNRLVTVAGGLVLLAVLGITIAKSGYYRCRSNIAFEYGNRVKRSFRFY